MSSKCNGNEGSYNRGCRCDLCKQAASDARRERRRLEREAVGEFAPVSDIGHLASYEPRTGEDGSVVAAVRQEISDIGAYPRPGLAAAALSLAAVLDNPRATSSKPAAAGALVNILNQLRKSAKGAKSRLASVRAMTFTDSADDLRRKRTR